MGSHPEAQQTAEWMSNNIQHRNIAELGMRHVKNSSEGLTEEHKTSLKHFSDSLHMPEVRAAAGKLTSAHTLESGLELLNQGEKKYQEKMAKEAPKLAPMEGNKVLDLGDGVAVYNLPLDEYGKNHNEAEVMGHCATVPFGELWSIRKDHGNGMVEPMVTIHHHEGFLGEIKGKYNWKPSARHHVAIAKLMNSDLIKGFVNGGYGPESNFDFDDLKDDLRKKLFDSKPSLKEPIYREDLPKEFHKNYPHVPEIKTRLGEGADVKKVVEQFHIADEGVKKAFIDNALHVDNLHPEIINTFYKYLKDGRDFLNTKETKEITSKLAKHDNTHGEILHHLAELTGSNLRGPVRFHLDFHDIISKHKNITEETAKKILANSPLHGYGGAHAIRQNLAENENFSPDFLHSIYEMEKQNPLDMRSVRDESFKTFIKPIFETLIKNKKLSPQTLHMLYEDHKQNTDPNKLNELEQYNETRSRFKNSKFAPRTNIISKIISHPNIDENLFNRILMEIDSDVWAGRESALDYKKIHANSFASHHKNIYQFKKLVTDLFKNGIQHYGMEYAIKAAQNPKIESKEMKSLLKVASRELSSGSKNEIIRELLKNPKAPKDVLITAARNTDYDTNHDDIINHPTFNTLNDREKEIIVSNVRPLREESIQRVTGLAHSNDDVNPHVRIHASREIKNRRKEKFNRILSPEGSLEDILHYAESVDSDIAKRALAELKRRGFTKSLKQKLVKMHKLSKSMRHR